MIEVGVRVGVAVFPDHAASAPHLLRRAEIAFRAAKDRHTSVSVFSSIDDPDTTAQLTLAHELRTIENEELVVYVQPCLDLATNTVTKVEALVRWIQPDGTVVPPDVFISVAERTGLIRPLTKFMLHACARTSEAVGCRGLRHRDLGQCIRARSCRSGVPGGGCRRAYESRVPSFLAYARDH